MIQAVRLIRDKYYFFLTRSVLFAVLLLVLFAFEPVAIMQSEDSPTACVLNGKQIGSQGKTKTHIDDSGDPIEDILATERHWGIVNVVMPTVEDPEMENVDTLTQIPAPETEQTPEVLLLIIDDFGSPLGQQTHGAFVTEVAQEYANRVYPDRIQIEVVDYAPEPTLGSVITNTVETLNTLLPDTQYKTIVVNMSWVILGCEGELIVEVGSETQRTTVDVVAYYNSTYEEPDEPDINEDDYISLDEYIILVNDLPQTEEMLESVQRALVAYVAKPIVLDLDSEWFDETSDILNDRQELLESIVAANSAAQEYQIQLAEQLNNTGATLDLEENEINEEELIALFNLLYGNAENLEVTLPPLVPVAAAGNNSSATARYYPSAPAAWGHVLAVSGSWANNIRQYWPYSNGGQVIAPAAWHQSSTREFVSGTSFSSAMVSYFVSILAHHTDCNFDPAMNSYKASSAPYIDTLLAICS